MLSVKRETPGRAGQTHLKPGAWHLGGVGVPGGLAPAWLGPGAGARASGGNGPGRLGLKATGKGGRTRWGAVASGFGALPVSSGAWSREAPWGRASAAEDLGTPCPWLLPCSEPLHCRGLRHAQADDTALRSPVQGGPRPHLVREVHCAAPRGRLPAQQCHLSLAVPSWDSPPGTKPLYPTRQQLAERDEPRPVASTLSGPSHQGGCGQRAFTWMKRTSARRPRSCPGGWGGALLPAFPLFGKYQLAARPSPLGAGADASGTGG